MTTPLTFVASLAVALAIIGDAARAQHACVPPPALRHDSGTAQHFGQVAEWFMAQHQTPCAMAAFHRGIELDPLAAPLHYGLGTLLYGQGQRELAAEEMRRTLVLDPQFDRAYLVLGIIAHDLGDRSTALRDWEAAAQLNPSSITTLDWIAKARIEAGQYTEALDLLQTGPVDEDLSLDALLAASKASLPEEGISKAQRAVAEHAGWTRLRLALASVLVQRNRYEEAVALLRAASESDPNSLEAQLLLLRVLLLMGDSEGARPYAARLLANQPQNFDVLYLNGLLQRQDSQFAAALPLLQRAAALQPAHYDVRFNLGVVYAKLHRNAEAKTELSHAAAMAGASAEVHFQLASVLRSEGEVSAAETEMGLYRKELAARAQHDELVSLSAQAAEKLHKGDAQGAAELERTILGKFPDEPTHWYDLALALDRLGDQRGEATALQHAVELRPTFAMAWNQLGYVRARAGEVQASEEAFRKAIACAPQYAEAENNLGSLLAENGRDQEAEPLFRAALASNPRLIEGWINLAASLATEGQYGQARQAAQKALAVAPDNPDAKRMLEMLAAAPSSAEGLPR